MLCHMVSHIRASSDEYYLFVVGAWMWLRFLQTALLVFV